MVVKNFVNRGGVMPAVSNPVQEPVSMDMEEREVVKLMVIGSPRAVENTIRVLYLRGFAELYEWSSPQPTQNPGEVMSLMRRLLRFS
jgi:hypothetical protein